MKSSDLARGRQALAEDCTRQAVRQHEANQQASVVNNEILPRAGIIGFLGGWCLMSAINSILKKNNHD